MTADGSDGQEERPRLFVAVPLPEAATDHVRRLVAALPSPPEDQRPVRWVRLDGLHLTLRFLGETPRDRIDALRSAVDDVAAVAHGFTITIAGGGAFPGLRQPRTLWLGVAEGREALGVLAQALDDRLVAAGWPRQERPFRPHLTLARSDGVRAGAQTAAALTAAAEGFSISFEARRIVLFQSRTGRGPATYEPLHGSDLAG